MSDEVSLSTIYNLVKNLGDRISVIEDANGNNNNGKRKSPDSNLVASPVEAKKRYLNLAIPGTSTTNNTFVKPANLTTGNALASKHPDGRVSVGNSLSAAQSRVRHLAPCQGEPSASGIEISLATDDPEDVHPLVIDASITDDFSNLEEESNVDLDDLEQIVMNEIADPEVAVDQINQRPPTNVSLDSNNNLPILGNNSTENWNLSESTLDWFKKVADLELKEEEISEIDKLYTPAEDIKSEFLPPDIPLALWNKMKNNNSEYYKQKSLLRAQKLNCMALKPILTVLDRMDNADPNVPILASAIQLMCCANLQIGKTRRSATARHVRNDLRGNLFSNPVSHTNLFGMEFDSATEQAVKSSNSLQKLLAPARKPFIKPNPPNVNAKVHASPSYPNPAPIPGPSSSSKSLDKNQFFRRKGTRGSSYSGSRFRGHRK